MRYEGQSDDEGGEESQHSNFIAEARSANDDGEGADEQGIHLIDGVANDAAVFVVVAIENACF